MAKIDDWLCGCGHMSWILMWREEQSCQLTRVSWDWVGSDGGRAMRKGKQGLAVTQGRRTVDPDWAYCRVVETLHFEELLSPTTTFSVGEAEFEDSGEVSSIFLAKVSEIVKKLLITRCQVWTRFTLRCWRLWTVSGCVVSVMSHGGWGQCKNATI